MSPDKTAAMQNRINHLDILKKMKELQAKCVKQDSNLTVCTVSTTRSNTFVRHLSNIK